MSEELLLSLLILTIGIITAVGMYVAYVKIIQPQRDKNNETERAYLYAAYAVGYKDWTNRRVRREELGRGVSDRLTLIVYALYKVGYNDARDGKKDRSEVWLAGASAYQKEVFNDIINKYDSDAQ